MPKLTTKESLILNELKQRTKAELIAILKLNDSNNYKLDSLYEDCTEDELRNYILVYKMLGGKAFKID